MLNAAGDQSAAARAEVQLVGVERARHLPRSAAFAGQVSAMSLGLQFLVRLKLRLASKTAGERGSRRWAGRLRPAEPAQLAGRLPTNAAIEMSASSCRRRRLTTFVRARRELVDVGALED